MRALIEAFDFSRFGTLVDVGGGNGALLAGVLAANPALQGVLFDLAHVVAPAQGPCSKRPVSRIAAGSRAAASSRRCPRGGDAYLLKRVIHDWEDEESIAILQVVRAAMSEGATPARRRARPRLTER